MANLKEIKTENAEQKENRAEKIKNELEKTQESEELSRKKFLERIWAKEEREKLPPQKPLEKPAEIIKPRGRKQTLAGKIVARFFTLIIIFLISLIIFSVLFGYIRFLFIK
ncbi:MAG: hypothetical protein PHF44_01170 [Candidatus Pacebacteria bacterium]|nr:hypothetical protein [Candidatus Paceibacterota bacterium]